VPDIENSSIEAAAAAALVQFVPSEVKTFPSAPAAGIVTNIQ
jgi:hypothetical protein